jgi:hypothetical protein
MPLGKKAKLYVKAGEININTLSDSTLKTELLAAVKTGTSASGWYEVCAVDVNRKQTKSSVDSSDRCSGDYGAFTPGAPEGSITFNAFKKIPAFPWQAIVRDAFNTDGFVTICMLDSAPNVTGAGGMLAVCNVFDNSENQPLANNIEISFEVRVSGNSQYSPPSRDCTMP